MRRRCLRSRGPHGSGGPLRGRRDVVYGPARREPPCQQLAARVPRDRPRGRRGDRSGRLRLGVAGLAARMGRKPRVGCGRGSRRRTQLGRIAAPDVELRRHRAHRQAPRTREAPVVDVARRDPGVLRELPRDPGSARAAQSRRRRIADRQERAIAAREPRPALQPRLAARAAEGAADRAVAPRAPLSRPQPKKKPLARVRQRLFFVRSGLAATRQSTIRIE
ncbi:protein of unknown function [Burkholderia multivorans]